MSGNMAVVAPHSYKLRRLNYVPDRTYVVTQTHQMAQHWARNQQVALSPRQWVLCNEDKHLRGVHGNGDATHFVIYENARIEKEMAWQIGMAVRGGATAHYIDRDGKGGTLGFVCHDLWVPSWFDSATGEHFPASPLQRLLVPLFKDPWGRHG